MYLSHEDMYLLCCRRVCAFHEGHAHQGDVFLFLFLNEEGRGRSEEGGVRREEGRREEGRREEGRREEGRGTTYWDTVCHDWCSL